MPLLCAANAAISSGFKQAQQLDLHQQRNVTHLIEKKRSPAGCLHQAGTGRVGAGKGATLVAKQLGLKQVLRQAGAVHGHQRPVCAQTGLVHGGGHQLLARARLTEQQHSGHGGRHPGHQGQHFLKSGCPPDQALAERFAVGHGQRGHFFNEVGLLALRVQQRR